MASQVLSGASNPSYTNNTGENVRVVINYMRSLIQQEAARIEPQNVTGIDTFTYSFTLQMSWAGVSLTNTSLLIYSVGRDGGPGTTGIQLSGGPVTIGRNIAVGGVVGPTAPGSQNYAIEIPNAVQNRGDTPIEPGVPTRLDLVFSPGNRELNSEFINIQTAEELVTGTDVRTFPTEIILAPGQTFSAICGVHNIVVIPENG